MLEHLEDDLTSLSQHVLSDWEISAIRKILERFGAILDGEQAWLAHGDFDATHIYQEHGRFSGIIDFGEIRGTEGFYDLGHFRMRDGETLHSLVFPYLLEGYKEVASLPPDYEQLAAFSSLLIGVKTLARSLRKHDRDMRNHPGFTTIKRDIEALV